MDSGTSSGILRNNLLNTLQDAEEIVTKTKRAAGKEYRIKQVSENLNRAQEALDRINCDSSCKDKACEKRWYKCKSKKFQCSCY